MELQISIRDLNTLMRWYFIAIFYGRLSFWLELLQRNLLFAMLEWFARQHRKNRVETFRDNLEINHF